MNRNSVTLATLLLTFTLSLPSAANPCRRFWWNQREIGPNGARLAQLQDALESQRSKTRAAAKKLTAAEKQRLQGSWVGDVINSRIIATPFKRLAQISEAMGFKPGERFVDFGSGTGEPGLYLATVHAELEVDGYEINRAKVDGANAVAQEMKLTHARFHTQDLSEAAFELPDADYYYFYNPAYPPVIRLLAAKIRNQSFNSTSTRRHLVLLFGGDYEDGVWAPEEFRRYGFKPAAGFDAKQLKKIKLQVLEYPSI